MSEPAVARDPLDLPKTPRPVLTIKPSSGWVAVSLKDLWEYRGLIYFLTWRDIKIRYKQATLGAAWAIIQPVMNMLVFSFFFGRLAKMSSDGVPYPVWNFAGLVPWLFFANSLVLSSNSLVGNANLVKKVYFPRLIIPISTIGAGLVDFCITFLVLLGIMGYYHIVPTMQIIWLPFFVLLALTTSLGVGLWLTALNVEYRDVRFAVPFLIQFWMFASPVVYSSSLLAKHPEWQTIYALNPMVGVIEGFRWALLGTSTQPGPMVFVSALSALVVLVTGAFYFKRMERNFADVI